MQILLSKLCIRARTSWTLCGLRAGCGRIGASLAVNSAAEAPSRAGWTRVSISGMPLSSPPKTLPICSKKLRRGWKNTQKLKYFINESWNRIWHLKKNGIYFSVCRALSWMITGWGFELLISGYCEGLLLFSCTATLSTNCRSE